MISKELKAKVMKKLKECAKTIRTHYDFNIDMPEVRYDLKGKAAGQAAVSGKYIRLHPIFLSHYEDEYINDTVVHEYAHIVQTMLFPETTYKAVGRMEAHGTKWKEIMRVLGVEPTRCHSYSMSVLNDHTGKYRKYMCTCCNKDFLLSPRRHNKVMKKITSYSHAACNAPIIFVGP